MNMNNAFDTTSTSAFSQMMLVAQASMDLWDAEYLAANARGIYHDSIRLYEQQHGPLVGMLSATSKKHAAVRKFTATTYEAYQASKRNVYNAKRRLKKACTKAACFC